MKIKVIQRDEAIKALQKEIDKAIPPFDDTIGAIRAGVRLARNIIEDLPYIYEDDTETVEAEPIKHGQWLSIKVMDDEADFGETDGAECSVCGYTTNSEYWAKTYYHYCPYCGARMDGGENG